MRLVRVLSLLSAGPVIGLAALPLAAQARKEVVPIPGASSTAPFSAVVRVGNLLFLSGQLGTIPGQGLAPGGITAETRQALENVKRLVEAAGSTMEQVAKCTVFLADVSEYRQMNEVYRTFFPSEPPARSTVAVAGLVLNARVEIECMAVTQG